MSRNQSWARTMHPHLEARLPRRCYRRGIVVVLALFSVTLSPGVMWARVCCHPGSDQALDLNNARILHILNSYYPGAADAVAGTTSLILGPINRAGAPTPLAHGDKVLIIQMQDAAIDATDTDAYGDGSSGDGMATGSTDIGTTGAYEFGCVSRFAASILTLTHSLQHSYRATPPSTFQVVRVPQYTHLRIRNSSVVTAPAWDGTSGGIVALDATNRMIFRNDGTIDVDGLGFRGAPSAVISGDPSDTFIYTAATRAGNGGSKGEGIAGIPATISGALGYSGGDYARGAPGNAGGGGNEHNAGGGGGGNGGAGGTGGRTWIGKGASMVGGFGGAAVAATSSRLVMGGGGGEGGANNFGDTAGAAGGGIVILHADTIRGNSGIITANGLTGGATTQDGAGGGGAGGSVLVLAVSDRNGALPLTITANGGDGGNSVWPARDRHGPGGGGGGGLIFTSHPPTSASVAGGSSGLAGDGSGSPAFMTHDATSGNDGLVSAASTSVSACLGASKVFSKADAEDLEAPWTLYMDLAFENFSDTQMARLSAQDDLDAVFGATGAGTWTFTSISTLTAAATGTLAHNANYDGSTNVDLLNGGTLEAGETATIRVQFELHHASGSFDNQITARGRTSVESYSDLSVDGSDPDGTDNDGKPDEDSLSTLDLSSLPVSLTSFEVMREGKMFQLTWTTATESANIGFHLDGKIPHLPWMRLTTEMIASRLPDVLTSQTYTHAVLAGDETQFRLVAVDRLGNTTRHGPFELNRLYGRPPEPLAIDWPSIKAEQTSPPVRARQRGRNARARGGSGLVLYVSETGIYRVDFETLSATGLQLSAEVLPHLALTHQGQPIPLYVAAAKGEAGVKGYLEFYGQAIEDSLYTRTNAYVLQINSALAQRVSTEHRPLPAVPPLTVAQHVVAVERNRAYSFSAPLDDPWYDTQLLALNGPVTHDFPLMVEHLSPHGGPIRLEIELYGGTSLPQRPDHHVAVDLNGVPIARTTFDGLSAKTIRATVPPGVLQEGLNHLTLALPHDSGAEFDLVYLEGYQVSYPRQLIAQQAPLTFTAAGPAFQVQGLSTPHVLVYRLDNHTTRLTPHVSRSTHPAPSGHYAAQFTGTATPARYIFTTEDALRAPQSIARVFDDPSLRAGRAQYLIITHARFRHELTRLVQARQADGYTVKVVDVADIYAQFGHHIVHAEAIRDYISYAHRTLGAEFVLLVGGDTYDYFDYLGRGSLSLVPTLYASTHALIRYTPTEVLLADTNADAVPDVHIGRLPVRTVNELQTVIDKTLAYDPTRTTAIFAADRSPSGQFSTLSEQLKAFLPADWQVATAYIDDLTAAEARSALLAQFNQGPALVNFIGHSGPRVWSFDHVLTATDAQTLRNVGQPTIVVQWGCWNTYHVAPDYHTLGHQLMLSGPQGAAAVMGSSTLTQTLSDQALAPLVLDQLLKPGKPIGQAITEAKQILARSYPRMLDVLLGWTLLGDPALVMVR